MSSPVLSVRDVLGPIAADMDHLNEVIRDSLHSQVSLINTISDYIIQAGGKRLRPALVLLGSRALGATHDQMVNASKLAAIVEFIHTATLLHDDVVDDSSMRRGRLTANAEYGNPAAVLVGDFLYSRSFQMMNEIGSLEVMQVLADTTNTIAEGEVLQLLNCRDPEVTEERYLKVIDFKTAKLFEASGKLSALSVGAQPKVVAQLGRYGSLIGSAFQLIDDVLDYAGDASDLGKNVGDDLREGKPTLPLIYALKHGSDDTQRKIRQAIVNGGTEEVNEILASIRACGALEYTEHMALDCAAKARLELDALPESPYKTALTDLCTVAVKRKS